MKNREMKIAEVTWWDSRLHLTQEPLDDDYSPCLIQSIGYIHISDKTKIVLIGDKIEKDGRRIIVIPKSSITRITYL